MIITVIQFLFCSLGSEICFFSHKIFIFRVKKGLGFHKDVHVVEIQTFFLFFFRRSRGVLLQCVILTLSAQKHPFLCLWYRIVHISRESSIYLECDNSVVSIFMFIFQRFYFLVEKKTFGWWLSWHWNARIRLKMLINNFFCVTKYMYTQKLKSNKHEFRYDILWTISAICIRKLWTMLSR